MNGLFAFCPCALPACSKPWHKRACPPKPWRRRMRFALCALRYFEVAMPAIASLEDLKAAQKDLLEAKDLNELKAVFKKWRRIGWKNICKLWLEERTPEQLKGEDGHNLNFTQRCFTSNPYRFPYRLSFLLLFFFIPSTFSMGSLLSPSQECHPFYPSSLAHDLVVSALLSSIKSCSFQLQNADCRLCN